jgi:hypothetical protein
MTKAIATIIVGEKYQKLWKTVAQPSWMRYARRHGYELVVFEELLDSSPVGLQRAIAWQKLLTLGRAELSGVDRVLWLDSDIIINPAAPDAVEQVPLEKIGAVPDQCLLSHPSLATPFAKNNCWSAGPGAWSQHFYKVNELPVVANYHLNSGVWVASPRHHRQLFEHIYHTHPEKPFGYFEQMALSSEVIGRGLHHVMDPRFNVLWLEYRLAFYSFILKVPQMLPLAIAMALRNSFFLHFADGVEEMGIIDPRTVADFDDFVMPAEQMERIADGWRQLAAARAKPA